MNETQYQNLIFDYSNGFIEKFNEEFELCRIEGRENFVHDFRKEIITNAYNNNINDFAKNKFLNPDTIYFGYTFEKIDRLFERNNKLKNYFDAILEYCKIENENENFILVFDAKNKALIKVEEYIDSIVKEFMNTPNEDFNENCYAEDKNDYSINTGFIYSKLRWGIWREFNRDFLKVTVQEALFIVLYNKDVPDLVYNGNNSDDVQNPFKLSYRG